MAFTRRRRKLRHTRKGGNLLPISSSNRSISSKGGKYSRHRKKKSKQKR